MASICNDDWASLGVMSGHERKTLRLSLPGQGSCFSRVLPRWASAPIPAAPLPAVEEQPLAGLTLWVLDDDQALREAMVMRLQPWGAQVLALGSLADLQDALTETVQATAARPDLFLTDQRMADGSGALAVQQAKASLGADLPCLLVTGDPDASDTHALVQAGVPLLTKPFAMPVLLQALKQALRH